MSDPVGFEATLVRNSIARDIADVMFGTVDDGVILDALQWQGCLLAANRIMESRVLPGTVTTEYHDSIVQSAINERVAATEALRGQLSAAVSAFDELQTISGGYKAERDRAYFDKSVEHAARMRAETEVERLKTELRHANQALDETDADTDRRVSEAWEAAARAVLEGADVAPGPDGKPTFIIPGPGPIANPGSLP